MATDAQRDNRGRRLGPDGENPLRVGFLGGFGGGSTGNDASLDAALELVRRVDRNAEVVCLCANPDVARTRFGIPAESIRARRPSRGIFASPIGRILRIPFRAADVFRAVRIVRSLDALIVPGTGILDDYRGERPTGWPLTLAVWFTAARVWRVRTALVGIGAGPLTHPVSRKFATVAVRLADYRSYRDGMSRDFVVKNLRGAEADSIIPDIAFSLPVPKVSALRTDPRPLVVVPIMQYAGWTTAAQSALIEQRHERTLSEFCGWLLREGYAVNLVIADGHDHFTTERVQQLIVGSVPDLAASWLTTSIVDDWYELARVIAPATAVVASRYHSIICALTCVTPTISLSYAPKNDEVMSAAGLSSYCQQIEDIDLLLLRRQFRELMENHGELSAAIALHVSALRTRLVAEEERLAASVLKSRVRHR